jgi:hypothetical protein
MVVLVFILLFTVIGIDLLTRQPTKKEPNIFSGVDVGYGDENDVYKVANAVSGFANLIVIGSTRVTNDTAALTRVCDFLYKKGFSFIVYVGYAPRAPQGPDRQFFNATVKQWGDKFLGAYIFDEIGGKQLDYPLSNPDKPVHKADNYSDATTQFVHLLNTSLLSYTGPVYYNVPNLKIFTSDYGLYWFDYLFGYNTVFGEFVGNQSRQLTVALCRGAANVQHMDWGTMITWKYEQAPFLEDGNQLYSDMVLAYNNTAKYIVVFDSPGNNTATSNLGLGILQQEHLDAMKQFWNYAINSPLPQIDPAETAYVLPSDYGFGFRRTDDNIWGLWPADTLAPKIWNDTNNLIAQYGMNLDIVYETLSDNLPTRLMYNRLIFWNSTIIGEP